MKTVSRAPGTIDEYIAGFAPEIQKVLKKIRATIHKAAPDAQETIKYQMPTFTLKGNLVYFAAYKKHIGMYPPISDTATFKKELTAYEGPKGAIRFPLDEPIPYALITKIVKFRVKEDLASAAAKDKKKLLDE